MYESITLADQHESMLPLATVEFQNGRTKNSMRKVCIQHTVVQIKKVIASANKKKEKVRERIPYLFISKNAISVKYKVLSLVTLTVLGTTTPLLKLSKKLDEVAFMQTAASIIPNTEDNSDFIIV